MQGFKSLLGPFASRAAAGISAFLVTYGVENHSAETIAAGAVATVLVAVDWYFDRKTKK